MHVLIPALHRPIKPTGVCRHAVNLAQCLANTDDVSRVTLLIGKWQQEYFETAFNLDSLKINFIFVDIKNSSFARNAWFMFGLPKLAKQLQPDIIHMSFPFPYVRNWFEGTVVATIHDLYPYECPKNFGYPQVWFNQLFLQQCVRNSDGLLSVSKCTLDALKDYFPKIARTKQTAVVYNVVDFSDVDPQVPQKLGPNRSKPFLMAVAQHRKNKNLNLLIQAYDSLQKDGKLQPNTQLLLVGSPGPETETLQQLVQTLGLEGNILFLSGLTDGELRWLYEHASLLVTPSATEGFCLPLVEALTLSCPAVCSDIPIFREVGSSQCHYFQLGHQAAHNLSVAISSALSHSSQRKRVIEERFSGKEISRNLLNFYRAL